ncbi:MAG: aldo/keto reductase [Sphaerochaetaceae bacterium]|nr:aldo/keto reductase [Spirochaetales bacterium]MDY5499628.1 aldo/keto reductase [Sphaerochaetaceae bacterium]
MRTDTRKTELALGTWAFAGNAGFWSDQKRSDSLKTLHLAIRSGIRAFDTAYAYQNGRAEQMLGQQLKRFPLDRNTLFISTKTMGRDNLRESLSRLLTDYVDIWYLHWPSSKRDVRQTLERMGTHPEAKTIGICNVTPSYLESLLKDVPVKAVQVHCSLLWTRNLRDMVSFCREHGIFLSGYSPIGMGLLGGRHDNPPDDTRGTLYCYQYPLQFHELLAGIREISLKHQCSMSQVALSWAMAQGFDQIVLGARAKEQLAQDSEPVSLSEDERAMLTTLGDDLSSRAPAWQDTVFAHRW